MSRTAVVILNYNGEKLLKEFLPSVIRHSSAEVIVADNGSTDGSLALLAEAFPDVKTISLGKNYGFCGGYNRALKEVTSDYYVLLNSDIEVTPGWVETLENVLASSADIGAVQPKILSYRDKRFFEYAGAGGGFIDALGYPFCRGRMFDWVEEDHQQYNDTREVFWASGACLMIRAELFHRFGGFDEDFFAHMEEIDLCWKLHRAGFRVYYCGQSTVYHLGAGTLGYESPKKTYLNFRNGLVMITKHFTTKETLLKLPLRVLLDGVAALRFLMKGQPAHMRAVFRAYGYFLANLKKIGAKRAETRRISTRYAHTSVYPGLALVEYFVKGRRHLM